ncbi:MAG: outer membrane protein transport protein [Betaproteobacteria bacterium]|nr:outer membrane protein transport protein [Betaproteobacteria bacterium]
MRRTPLIVALAALGFAGSAFATTGHFSHGYGIKSKGMGGVGIAYGQDALAAATNPANMVLVGNRWDVGIDYFRPQRESEIGGVTFDGNDSENYFMPEFGYNRMISNDMSLGVSVYGNGGMATDYKDNLFGGGSNGVDLAQLFIAPTVSMKLNENHSVGVSLKLAYQRFEMFGIQPMCNGMSQASTKCSDNGHDSSFGYGFGLGWTGKVSPTLTLGATYQSKTYMDEFDDYKGLFAEQGDFDIPENWGVGLAWQATPKLLVAFDYQRIHYEGVKSLSNKMFEGGPLGADNGTGFGWEDINVYKLGLAYQYDKNLVLRAGYIYNDEPYDNDQTFFNILAPGVIKQHVTLGATWTLAGGGELTVAYMHAFENTVKGKGATAGIDNTMYQDSFGVSYGAKF